MQFPTSKEIEQTRADFALWLTLAVIAITRAQEVSVFALEKSQSI